MSLAVGLMLQRLPVHQLQVECAQVPPRLENRLELLQQVQSLRAEIQQSSRVENEALRRENEAQMREIAVQRIENEAQRREIEAVRADMARKNAEFKHLRQNSSAQQVRYESKQGNFLAQRDALQRDMEALRAELTLKVERSQTETESLRAQVQ